MPPPDTNEMTVLNLLLDGQKDLVSRITALEVKIAEALSPLTQGQVRAETALADHEARLRALESGHISYLTKEDYEKEEDQRRADLYTAAELADRKANLRILILGIGVTVISVGVSVLAIFHG